MDRCQLSNGQKQKTLWPRLLLVFISVRAKKNAHAVAGALYQSTRFVIERSWVRIPLGTGMFFLLVQCALKQVPREAAALLDAQLRRLRQNEVNDG